MKITVSGWPGAGTSTLSLILAKCLDLKLLRGTETFRYLGKELSYGNTGEDRFKADKYLEEYFGKIYDEYIDAVLCEENDENLIIESDIAVFRIGKKHDIYSIFLETDIEIRAKRVIVDGRENDSQLMKIRDEENRKFYKKLHNVDWFDINLIEQKHNLIMNNSYLSIQEELNMIYKDLQSYTFFNAQLLDKLLNETGEEEDFFWSEGKKWYENYLTKKNKIIQAEEILKDIYKRFSNDVNNLPEPIVNIFKKLTNETK